MASVRGGGRGVGMCVGHGRGRGTSQGTVCGSLWTTKREYGPGDTENVYGPHGH